MNDMQTMVTVSSRAIRQPRSVGCKIAYKRSLLRRVQHLIESADWDERYLGNPWIDKICMGVIIISLLYFIPVLAPIVLG
jgi:hypothetical protein